MVAEKVLTVAISSADLRQRLHDDLKAWGSRVEIIEWNMQEALPSDVAERVDMVVVGHYWEGRTNWNLLREMPNVSIIQVPSAGYEHVVPYVPPGVILCNGRGVHSAETAELAVGLMLAMQRGIAESRDNQREHKWVFSHLESLADRKVLVVGNGSVGQAIIDRLKPFEVELVVVARESGITSDGSIVHPVADLEKLVTDVDIMVLAIPLNDETFHLIDEKILSALPAGALLVNVARGGIVDQVALLQHLETGRLRAALDVTTPEPLPADDPLWSAPNVLITPHQGGNTNAGYPRFAAIVRRQINHLLNGEALENVVEL